MTQGFSLQQGGFRSPRVPFDLRCVVLAALGFLATWGADRLLEQILGLDASPTAQLVAGMAGLLDHVAFVGAAFRAAMEALWWGHATYTLETWEAVLSAATFFAVWSVFGAAILRTAALRLARDEPLSLKEALGFGCANAWAFFRTPVLVLLFAGVFAGLIWLAGLVIGIPVLGSTLLVLVLFPLCLLAGLLVVLALAGGFVGLPLMWAGISVEQNGPLEAITRGFSYIFARPFRFFFGYLLLFVVMSVLLLLASHFEDAVKGTLRSGIQSDFEDVVTKPPDDRVEGLRKEYVNSERARLEQEGIGNLRNIRRADWTDWVGFAWMWLLLGVFVVGFKGYALYVFLGGTVSLYLDLRHEVDGTDEEEIWPSTEDEALAEEARWVGEGQDPAAPAPEGEG